MRYSSQTRVCPIRSFRTIYGRGSMRLVEPEWHLMLRRRTLEIRNGVGFLILRGGLVGGSFPLFSSDAKICNNGHRPPRRIDINSARNNHYLNTTIMHFSF
mmetsp:Transcript_15655/g.45221  ORF Transcript_15655/g.45221 Transcript_15655/m.45221 type:complete len:101 (-) Transcript_15655:941-1243(-)